MKVKTTLLAVCAAALMSSSSAFGFLTFSVDAVSINSITLTITDGTTLGGPSPSILLSALYIDSISNNDFISEDSVLGVGSGSVGGVSVSENFSLQANNDIGSIGAALSIIFSGELSAGGAASSLTNTFNGLNLDFSTISPTLNLADVEADLRLSWGLNSVDDVFSLGTVQSPVPEPATYAAMAGLAALGCAVLRRRRK